MRFFDPSARPAFAAAIALLLVATACSREETELDQYGGWTGIQGEKTGFFHLEEINGRNWFITPDGNVFFWGIITNSNI